MKLQAVSLLTLTLLAAVPAVVWAGEVPAAKGAPSGPTNAPPGAAARPPHRVEAEELCTLLAGALNQRVGPDGGEWEIRLSRSWLPVSVPDEPLTLEIIEPALNRVTSTCILRFELRAGRQRVGSWQMPVQARLWRDILVAHANLPRGLALKDAPVTHERREVLALREPLGDLPANADAYELAETVPAGSPLQARALRLRPVVARGQIADAVVRDGAMVISLKVEVLEEGAPGQMIRVRNYQSRRELRGKVEDEHTIAITL
jgi:flagella basal body P-ring formation protein FlgA